MSRVMSVRRTRRNAGQWRDLLTRFEVRGLDVSEFCRRASVSTASFYRWRTRLGPGDRVVIGEAQPARTGFVDLGTVSSSRVLEVSTGMELHLDLGGGLSLHLVRR